MNLVALAWCVVLTVLLVLPPNQLAGYTFGGTCVLLLVAWFGGVRKRFVETLVRRGDFTMDEAEQALADFQGRLQHALEVAIAQQQAALVLLHSDTLDELHGSSPSC